MLVKILLSTLLWLSLETGQDINQEPDSYILAETISLDKTGISPNGDGKDDNLIITYNLNGTNNFCTMRIFDVNGNTMKVLLRNQAISGSGQIVWDGSDSDNKTVQSGYYNLVSEVWSETGDIRRFRSRITVIR